MAILMSSLILTRASVSRPSGQWREDDYDVLENGVVVVRIFCLDAVGPQGRPWMWASGHNGESDARRMDTTGQIRAAGALRWKQWRPSQAVGGVRDLERISNAALHIRGQARSKAFQRAFETVGCLPGAGRYSDGGPQEAGAPALSRVRA
jgi:hypothetical protein